MALRPCWHIQYFFAKDRFLGLPRQVLYLDEGLPHRAQAEPTRGTHPASGRGGGCVSAPGAIRQPLRGVESRRSIWRIWLASSKSDRAVNSFEVRRKRFRLFRCCYTLRPRRLLDVSSVCLRTKDKPRFCKKSLVVTGLALLAVRAAEHGRKHQPLGR